VDWGRGTTILAPNFLHHFDPDANVALLEKVRGALGPGGRAFAVAASRARRWRRGGTR
jgi:hypothetical protein